MYFFTKRTKDFLELRGSTEISPSLSFSGEAMKADSSPCCLRVISGWREKNIKHTFFSFYILFFCPLFYSSLYTERRFSRTINLYYKERNRTALLVHKKTAPEIKIYELQNKANFFQDRDQLQNAPVILMFQILCLSALLSPYNWGLSFHQLFHIHVLPFSLTVILILDISIETQLYTSIVIWLCSSENLSYSIKRFSDSFNAIS